MRPGLDIFPAQVLDVSGLSPNRQMPAAFPALLCVCDTGLPLRGTGHRSNRHMALVAESKPERNEVNCFCESKLWVLQSLGTTPTALNEGEFVVHGLTAAEGRRSLTDVQETSQWLGGVAVPKAILETLLGRERDNLVVIHGSFFDASVEKACLELNIPCISHTADSKAFSYASQIVKNHLLQFWKDGQGCMQLSSHDVVRPTARNALGKLHTIFFHGVKRGRT